MPGKIARSARGEIVNFDLIAVKQQLAAAPVPVGVDERRRFIDEKDGIRTRQVQDVGAFAVAQEGMAESESAAEE